MSGLGEGQPHANRSISHPMYLQTGDPGPSGGNTYSGSNSNETTMQQYENIFGPAARDIKEDSQRHKRHQRWHLPDALKGSNQYLTDRVDGLITDSTNSPFTRNILPYVYLENPDQKLKWNVYSFDEGISSRVPYESAARVLPQSKKSFAGYTVRQGLAIAMEHNFMASAAGRENFKNQLTQLVGSIQMTNDLDVHVALLQAPSYQKQMNEKYYDQQRTTAQVCRQYVDLFGIMQKVPNALDILIEDAKNHLQTWGSQPPTFLLCNGALTAQLTMLPEKTNYLTNGIDGQKRLAQGPELSTYRGLSIIHSRKFSMDTGTTPRDLLRRRVRVAEYYRIPWTPQNSTRTYEFYDQSRDTMFRLTWDQLCQMANLPGGGIGPSDEDYPGHAGQFWQIMPGAEEPEEFKWDTWDGDNHPAAIRLRLRNTGNNSYSIEGFESLLEALGIPISSARKPSSIIWPRSVMPTNGDKRKKRTLDQITKDVPEVQNAVSSKYIKKQMTPLQQFHHRQSETFGAGIYNEPIVDATTTQSKLNWTGLPDCQIQSDAALFAGMVTYAFDDLLEKLDLKSLEDQLKQGVVQPTQYEITYVGFLEEANARRKFCPGQTMNDASTLYAEPTNAIQNALRIDSATWNGALNAFNHAISRPIHNGRPFNADRANMIGLMSQLLQANGWTNANAPPRYQNSVAEAAATAMYYYLQILLEWRKLCFGDAIEHMITNNLASLQAYGNCGGHTHFASMKYGLMTACLAQHIPTASLCNNHQYQNNLHDDATRAAMLTPTGPYEAYLNQVKGHFRQQNLTAKIAMNVVNASLYTNNVVKQPNLHINRCKPLQSGDEEDSASSINPASWLLQHIASMMPLTKDMAEPFMKTSGNLRGPQRTTLINEYQKFLHGRNNFLHSEYDTFLMHWFMSEFHPTAAVRNIARKECGMNANEMHRVERFMNAMADALEKNTTSTSELQQACADIAPGKFDARPQDIIFSVATSAKKYDCVRKWSKDKNLHITSKNWYDTPVDVKKIVPLQSDNNTRSNFASVNDQPENTGKVLAKASAQYHRGNLRTRIQDLYPDPNVVYQTDQQYYDVDRNTVHQVQTGDHLVNLSHPWTNFIPRGIEALSSTNFPIDWQYREEETDPQYATQNVSDGSLRHAAESAAQACRNSPHEAMREVLMILFTRFFKPAGRFMNNGAGVALARKTWTNNAGPGGGGHWNYPGYAFAGCHLKHGPYLLETSDSAGPGVGGAQDIVILRPNIEHEMLGIVMGRGGTQELGSTFWGQTELSCYDDAQHGIWGMSYKYHERAIVTNERNMIRVFDVAFDGYNGGMDQSHVEWGNPSSTQAFMQNTFNRSQAYHGDSMLVMALPHHEQTSNKSWPNPIMFQPKDSGNSNPDPEKSAPPANTKDHVVFSHDVNPSYCTTDQQNKYDQYMQALGMSYWTTPDISNRPAGDCCIGNETSAHMMAFEGTMKVYNANGGIVSETQGSGHLGPSYVGVASVREGRGILNPNVAPTLGRLI